MPGPTKSQKTLFKGLQKIDPNAQVTWDEKTGTPSHLRGSFSGPQAGAPETIAQQFLTAHKGLFAMKAPEEEVQLKGVTTDARGNKHVRYRQVYKTLPVFGGELVVHLTSDNAVRGVNGKYTPGIDLPTDPKISAKDVGKIIVAHAPGNKTRPGDEPILVILVHEDKPHLAWHMSVEGTDVALDGSETEALWAYFVDAQIGEVIWRYNNLQTDIPTTGSGKGNYAGTLTLNTVHNHVSNKWELEDRWVPSTARIYTHDGENGLPPKPVSVDSDNNWSANDQGAEVDCHAFTRTVFDYFLMMHGRNSFDGAGADMNIYAHFKSDPNRAENNAYWDPLNSWVVIGDGDGVTFGPFCTLDIIAHEWTHAVTTHTANLIYYGESGALNESISDVFAALIDGDWLQGEDNWLNKREAPAGRNLADPTNGGKYDPADPIGSTQKGHQPDHYNDRYIGPRDNQGVHINSGVMNKAAYLIAVGGTHRGIKICEGLGREVLGRLYYNALTSHLTANSNFADMRQAVLNSLDDLYAGDPRYDKWRVSINNAFAAVGVGTAQMCPATCWLAPVPPCLPAPVLTCAPAPVFTCPPAPGCLPGPIFTCPPASVPICPPASSVGCLPGPDPSPFTPSIKPR